MKWDQRFLALAAHVAEWSKDESTRVGAVITDGNRIISIGFNGAPRGVDEPVAGNRETKLLRTIHAEGNALAFAHRDLAGCTLYCTHPPCAHCAAAIIQRGITRVVYTEPSHDFLLRWGKHYTEGALMFSEAGVVVEEI